MDTRPDPVDADRGAAPLDSGVGRFRPRARLLRTIGAELISSETVAVIELVRNCYDADARQVTLEFIAPHIPERARIVIRDDGHGMTRDTLLGPWLEPATDHKATGAGGDAGGDRSPSGRRRLGSKGVGRFATQRLGGQLAVYTRASGARRVLRADFDWSSLVHGDSFLDQLSIPWSETRTNAVGPHGTTLYIERLHDVWNSDRFERLKIGLSRLVSPVRSSSDPFQILLVIDGMADEIRPAIEAVPSMYWIEGRVSEGGAASIAYRDQTGAEERWERTVTWPHQGATSGPFTFRLNAWDLDREPLRRFLEKNGSALGMREFRRLVRDHSGISLYRDAFRILPYGEPDNDWLRLDRRRVNNPTLRFSNNQISGAILLGADTNPHLRDQTNREGLVANEAYLHLQRAVLDLLSMFEVRRFAARRTLEGLNGPRTRQDARGSSPVDTELEILRRVVGEEGNGRQEKSLRQYLTVRRQREADASAHLTTLAAIGQLSSAIFSEVEAPLQGLERELALLRDDVADGVPKAEAQDLAVHVERLRARVADLVSRVSKLEPLAGVPARRGATERFALGHAANEVLSSFASTIEALGISVTVHDPEHFVEGTRHVVVQALALLIQNSLDELVGVRPGGRTLRVLCRDDGLDVLDSGRGIAPQNAEFVFEPYFTTRDGHSGLGLTIARDLMRGAGGDLRLRPTPKPSAWLELRMVAKPG